MTYRNRPSADMRMQRSLNMRIQQFAKQHAESSDLVRKKILFEAFLMRVFLVPDGRWVLKGGTALLIRNGNGRFTKDIDLALQGAWPSIDELEEELEEIASRQVGDPFTFRVTSKRTQSPLDPTGYTNPTYAVKIAADIGAMNFGSIRIDVSLRRHTQEPIVTVPVTPMLNGLVDDPIDSFFVAVTAIEGHMADKICAMYELHGETPSGRYHDLADLIRIIETQTFCAEKLSDRLMHEARRRRCDLPESFVSPGGSWAKGYEQNSKDYAYLPHELRTLEAALNFVGMCLNRVLSGERMQGKWNPSALRWED